MEQQQNLEKYMYETNARRDKAYNKRFTMKRTLWVIFSLIVKW